MFRDLIGKGVEICNIGLQQGYIKEDGSVSTSGDTDHSKWVCTDFISGGRDFICHLQDGFFINKVSVYDENFQIMKDTVVTTRPRCYKQCTEYSFHLHKAYKMRLSIIHDGTITPDWTTVSEQAVPDRDVSPDEDIFKDFFYVDRSYFDVLASDDPSYQQALRRVNHLTFLAPTNYKNEFINFGVKYSDQNETPGRVGFEVSPYSYCTAVHNPRSAYWTENVQNHKSQYGWKYHDGNGSSNGWFGQNCSNSVDWVRGYDKALHFARNYAATSAYGSPTLDASVVTPDSTCSNLRPLDNIVKSTHVWIVAEIWKDASGTPRFIRCAESGGGNTYYTSTLYSVESWLGRITGVEDYQITRLPNNITATQEPLLDYVGDDLTDDFTPITYNDDICTFIGDKVEFMWGGIIYLNVHRYNGWENVIIEKWNETNQQYETFQTLDITSGTTYPIRQLRTSNDYTTGTAYYDTDWIDVKLSQYFPYGGTEYGKYRAYCTTSCKNLFDFAHNDSLTPPESSGKNGYWLSANTGKITASTDGSKTWAIPCKPNTTYTVSQDTNNTNTLLRVAYGTMSNLNFVNTGGDATVYSITNHTTVGEKRIVSITTEANATYLFVQVSATNSRYEDARQVLVLREASNTTVQSDPTYFEVLAVKLKCYVVNGMNQYDIEQVNGTPLYITSENGSGFTNSELRDSSRFRKPGQTNLQDHFCWWSLGSPNATYPYVCIRVKGEYGYGKYETGYKEPTNYYDQAYYQANMDINTSTGSLVSNNYRNTVIIENATPGDTYRYFYKRNLSADYSIEKYAFYDDNDQLVGDVQKFYSTADGNIPETGTYPHWDFVVPAGASKIKIGCLKDTLTNANTLITLYNCDQKPRTNYYSEQYWQASKALDSSGNEVDNQYRNLVTINDLNEGDVYSYSYSRTLSDAYNYENYGWYDENGALIEINRFYTTGSVPAIGTSCIWILTVPANAKTLKIAALTGNSGQKIYNQTRPANYNYYNAECWLSNKDVNSTTGETRDSQYRNLVSVIGVQPGEVYRYAYHRELGSAYNYETYSFYDANGQYITPPEGTSYVFYTSSIGTIPSVGSDPYWDLTIPANCAMIRIGALKGNSNISIRKLQQS